MGEWRTAKGSAASGEFPCEAGEAMVSVEEEFVVVVDPEESENEERRDLHISVGGKKQQIAVTWAA